ncbi:MAG: hypothetical protein H7833_14735 [Magnetococcus sp. DMHC-1]|nr:hypothetical protein [Magnetococcales bacterium]
MFDNLLAGQPESVAWIVIGFGALLAIAGVLKIIGNGISFLIWVLLVVAGTTAIQAGLRHQNSVQLSQEMQMKLGNIIEPGKALSQDAMRALCDNLTKLDAKPKTKEPASGLQPTVRQ